MELTNIKVSETEISYDLNVMGNSVTQKGTIEGNVIKITMDMPGGGQGMEMTLRKVE